MMADAVLHTRSRHNSIDLVKEKVSGLGPVLPRKAVLTWSCGSRRPVPKPHPGTLVCTASGVLSLRLP